MRAHILLPIFFICFITLIVAPLSTALARVESVSVDSDSTQRVEEERYIRAREEAKKLELQKQKGETLSPIEQARLDRSKAEMEAFTDINQARATYDTLIRKNNLTPEEQKQLEAADKAIRSDKASSYMNSPELARPGSPSYDPVPGREKTECTFSTKNSIYCMLAPIGIFTDNKQLGAVDINPAGLSKFLNNIVKFAIAIASGLAVMMIVLGGVQYASTDAMFGKSEGKARIQQALSGLLLAILSYAILNTINPDVFSTSLNLKKAGTVGNGTVVGQATHDPSFNPVGASATGYTANGGSGEPRAVGSIYGLAVQGTYNPIVAQELKNNGIEPTNILVTDPKGNQFVGGKGSIFGGPSDHDNGLGDQKLPLVPGKTAKQLDVTTYYVAFRWDYSKTPTDVLMASCVEVYIPKAPGENYFIAKPVDWGPGNTEKNVDVSPQIEKDAGMEVTGADVYIRFVSC